MIGPSSPAIMLASSTDAREDRQLLELRASFATNSSTVAGVDAALRRPVRLDAVIFQVDRQPPASELTAAFAAERQVIRHVTAPPLWVLRATASAAVSAVRLAMVSCRRSF